MAAHSCGVLKERFAKTRSLHRHDAEQWVWAAPNKPLATVILVSSKIFQEAVAVTAKQVRIGDRPCRIYGTDCAEYLLL